MTQKAFILFVLAICQSAKTCRVTDVVLELNVSHALTSPGYPSPYPSSSFDCIYTATAPVNSKVSMYCDVFDIPYSAKCSYAWFSFSPSGSETFIDGANYCGQHSSLTLQTTGNKFAAQFSNSWYNTNNQLGFRCYVTAVAVTTIAATSTTTAPTTKTSNSGELAPSPRLFCTCGKKTVTSRIVGGTQTTVNQYPWMVALKFTTTTRPYCGGTLLSRQWVLTAAQCLAPIQIADIEVVLGEHNVSSTAESSYTIKRSVIQKIVHENYNESTVDNDIGLIKLSSPVTFNAGISQACLPIKFSRTVDFNGVTGLALGWGIKTYQGAQSDVLMQVQLPVLGTTQCRKYEAVSSKITANMICTYKPDKGMCHGDSGGPLAYLAEGRYYIIGVSSWGIGCGQVGNPGVYTKVNNYIKWMIWKSGVLFCLQ